MKYQLKHINEYHFLVLFHLFYFLKVLQLNLKEIGVHLEIEEKPFIINDIFIMNNINE